MDMLLATPHNLDIPNAIQKHCTFPASVLHAVSNDLIRGQNVTPPLPVIVEGAEWVVEVLDSWRIRGWLHYIFKWRVLTAPKLEPEEKLKLLQAFTDYHEHYLQCTTPAQLILLAR